jgi:hypothetical protein
MTAHRFLSPAEEEMTEAAALRIKVEWTRK